MSTLGWGYTDILYNHTFALTTAYIINVVVHILDYKIRMLLEDTTR